MNKHVSYILTITKDSTNILTSSWGTTDNNLAGVHEFILKDGQVVRLNVEVDKELEESA